MKVGESQWISRAIDNVDRYLHRGGHLKGDDPQLLGGTDLLNTIGVAMGLPVRDPEDWTEWELQRALKNNLVYFEGKAREAIDVIADRIRKCCGGDDKNYVTVLPIELYCEGKLSEVPLFRIHRYENSKKMYVDNIGRSYDSKSDWYNNNQLPPCKMVYPYDLKLMLKPKCSYSRVVDNDTPSARTGSQIANIVDATTTVMGIGAGVGLLYASGGLAAPLVATSIATSAWGTGRTGYRLIDRATHGESVNPFTNSESRLLWLGVAAGVVGFGATGASMRLASMASRGREISSSFNLVVNVMNKTNIVVSGIKIIDATIFIIVHYKDTSRKDILLHGISIAFWTKGAFTYKTADTLIKNAQNQTFKVISEELSSEDAENLSSIRQQINNDALLIREIHRASRDNISIETFTKIVSDANRRGPVRFDGAGNLILPGGQRLSLASQNRQARHVRRQYFM